MHKRLYALLLITATTLLLSGCLTRHISETRLKRVVSMARFDTGCPYLEIVDIMGDRRYKLQGCKLTLVYACHDRSRYHPDGDIWLLDTLFTGGKDPDAPCRLESRIAH